MTSLLPERVRNLKRGKNMRENKEPVEGTPVASDNVDTPYADEPEVVLPGVGNPEVANLAATASDKVEVTLSDSENQKVAPPEPGNLEDVSPAKYSEVSTPKTDEPEVAPPKTDEPEVALPDTDDMEVAQHETDQEKDTIERDSDETKAALSDATELTNMNSEDLLIVLDSAETKCINFSSPSAMAQAYTVSELRSMAKKRGLAATGKKVDISKRIMEFDESEINRDVK